MSIRTVTSPDSQYTSQCHRTWQQARVFGNAFWKKLHEKFQREKISYVQITNPFTR